MCADYLAIIRCKCDFQFSVPPVRFDACPLQGGSDTRTILAPTLKGTTP
jgi:hypothetical protein